MPGLDRLQQQYVRYQGQDEARATSEGWTLDASKAALAKLSTNGADAAAQAKFDSPGMPEQVQLEITSAPAEFCLPMKNDRQFKPHFQVQVRVMHSGVLMLPLRLKAYAIISEDKQLIADWLPDELKRASDRKIRMLVELKGGTVVSNVFKTSTSSSGRPTISQIPQMTSANGRVTTATDTLCFPSKVGKAGVESRPALRHSDSIRSQGDDPGMATQLQDAERLNNSVVAQYEFKSLEFAKPTRMNRVYMVFACLVADQDLLFVSYEVPCISICRAEQRAKALDKLGMPPSVYDDIAGQGGSTPTVTGAPVNPGAAAAAAAARAASAAVPAASASRTSESRGGGGAGMKREHGSGGALASSSQAAASSHGGSQGAATAQGGTNLAATWQGIVANSGRTSHNDAAEAPAPLTDVPSLGHDLLKGMSLLKGLSNVSLGGELSLGGDAMTPAETAAYHNLGSSILERVTSLRDAMMEGSIDADLARLLSAGPDDFSLPHFISMVSTDPARFQAELRAAAAAGVLDLPSEASLQQMEAADALRRRGGDAAAGAMRAGLSGDDARPLAPMDHDAATRHHAPEPHHYGGEELDNTAPPAFGDAAAAGGAVKRGADRLEEGGPYGGREYDEGGTDERHVRASSGAGVPPGVGAPNFDMQRLLTAAAEARVSGARGGDDADMAEVGGLSGDGFDGPGVNQQEAYNWIIDEYDRTGLQRRLEVQDLRALLSLAGFPEMAGLDLSARIPMHQFGEFQAQFRSVLAMLRNIAHLWNIQDPCIVSGFDMDRLHTAHALAAQPAGTFICRFSMNQTGSLVLSCKANPGTSGASEGDLVHLVINLADLASRNINSIIMNVPYASHVLDVYSNRRVDKRHLLASDYMRVQRLFEEPLATELQNMEQGRAGAAALSRGHA